MIWLKATFANGTFSALVNFGATTFSSNFTSSQFQNDELTTDDSPCTLRWRYDTVEQIEFYSLPFTIQIQLFNGISLVFNMPADIRGRAFNNLSKFYYSQCTCEKILLNNNINETPGSATTANAASTSEFILPNIPGIRTVPSWTVAK